MSDVVLVGMDGAAHEWATGLGDTPALATPETLDHVPLATISIALVDGRLQNAIDVARRVHRRDAAVQVVIVAPAGGRAAVERSILLATGVGEVWVLEAEELGAGILERARKVTAQRRAYRTTRERIGRIVAGGDTPAPTRTRISDAYLAALLNVLADPVLSIDASGRVLSMNPAAEQAMAAGRAGTGMLVEEAIAVLDASVLREILARGSSGIARGEIRYRKPDGSIGIAEASVSPVEAAGRSIRALVLRDVTEERAIREQLEQQAAELEAQAAQLQVQATEMDEQAQELIERNESLSWLAAEKEELSQQRQRALQDVERLLASRSRFYASMSHELRTPINAILGYNDLLLAGIFGPLTPDQESGIIRVQKAANHLLELVNDVLDLSKIESGKIELVPEEVHLPGLIADLAETIRPIAEEHGCELRLDMSPCTQAVHTDPRRVRQILMNLLSNAAKFGSGRPVEVRCRDFGPEEFGIEVIDQGEGIAPEDQERIFEEFVQISQQSGSGTGLGLPISRRLARLLGGEIELESERGKGSTFRLRLARRMDPRAVQERSRT